MKRNDQRSQCPVNLALELFGDRWTLLIVRDVLLRGPLTYGQFLASEERIATNILADRLARLTAADILEQRPADVRSRHVYALTDKGLDLMPVLFELVLWGDRYFEANALGQDLARRYREDPGGLRAEFRRRHASGRQSGAAPKPQLESSAVSGPR